MKPPARLGFGHTSLQGSLRDSVIGRGVWGLNSVLEPNWSDFVIRCLEFLENFG